MISAVYPFIPAHPVVQTLGLCSDFLARALFRAASLGMRAVEMRTKRAIWLIAPVWRAIQLATHLMALLRKPPFLSFRNLKTGSAARH